MKSKPNFRAITGLLAVLFSPAALSMADEWTAYNDSIDTDPATTPENATNYGLGRSYTGDGDTGNLIDFATGADTGVQVSFVEQTSVGNTINWATDTADFPAGSDSEALFGGILNLTGNMSYNDGPGWHLDVTFSNLDANTVYTFAGTVHRNGGASYANRITNWSIHDAATFTEASSAGVHLVSESSVEFSTGNNVEGLVARWTEIRGGAGGSFTIRTTHGIGTENGGMANPDPYKGYAGGLFLLLAEPDLSSPFTITEVAYDPDGQSATISWPARPGRTYSVEASSDLLGWVELEDGITTETDAATFMETGLPASTAPRYYRVIKR